MPAFLQSLISHGFGERRSLRFGGVLKEGKGIACVEYDGKLGNPCVFSERYYGELMGLEGDVGGKRVVVRNRKDVAVMRVVDGREVMDVDVADGRR